MRKLGKTILLLMLCLLAAPRVWPAIGTEEQSFKAAEKLYLDGFYKNAEAEFGNFIQNFPGSPQVPLAVLFQAQARINLGDYNSALGLLADHQSLAGPLADEFLFCQAEASLAQGDFARADADFSKLIQQFPTSPRHLAAVVNAATARMRLAKWAEVTESLGRSNGVFQLAASTNRANPLVIRGYLLLSEAQLAQRDTHAAEHSLRVLAEAPLDSTNNWQRQYLLCRVLLADGRPEAAMENTTNLLVLAEATGQRSFQAQSFAFQASLLERLGRQEQASAVYEKNLSDGIPTDRQREALLKITELSLALGRIGAAAQVLETFLKQFPTNDCSDLALLTLGELRLRQYASGATASEGANPGTNAPAATHFLGQAVAAFQSFRTNFPQSPLLGKAELNLGWSYWLSGEIAESQPAFQAAAGLLPPSIEQAKAFFKLADAQFQLTNYPGAISNYSAVVDRFGELPDARTNLFEPALYQIIRASQAVGDATSATNALAKILDWFPNGFYTERAVSQTGEQIGQRFPAIARGLFSDVARSATNWSLVPEIELAIARTYEEEAKWDEAIQQYDTWLDHFTNHAARGRAEYFRGRANYQAGHETNALMQFTSFVARFPTNEYAPLAQWWAADYLYGLGSLQEAEISYKVVYQNWPGSPLAYPARMMAGRVAASRQDWDHAPDQFRSLYNDQNCPTDLRAQALFAYGDTLLSRNSTNKLADYKEAFNAFDLICKNYATNEIAALAWGQKALCVLQFDDYGSATNAFQKVIESPLANVTARSIAEVGLGLTLEKLADTKTDPERSEFLNMAMRHYQRVFYDNRFLREGEKPDSFWTRKAGIEAGRLAERLQLRDQAINVYRRLQEMFPPLRLEDKIKNLRAQG